MIQIHSSELFLRKAKIVWIVTKIQNILDEIVKTIYQFWKSLKEHHISDSVPFTTYNNTRNLRILQSAVQFCSVPKSADCGVLLYL